ncbi:polysaccharide biosynthesis tyrosine autokinase [Novosphingobium sp. fls2-241-R2A-195]|uniref:GumC family protein n=1 Tax=Novosphingobium sp. fls2-241-R2A-195 TaxID=3040296 RepID=UPI00254DE9D4|nr:polysaccharide biosynthesis tyrosine autokinase [Novosphingobium sp. fls2-241-R2A-195]
MTNFSGARDMLAPGQVAVFEPGVGTQDEASTGFNLRRIWQIVNRNRLFIGLIIVGMLCVGFLATILMVPQYVGTARVLVEQETEKIIEQQGSSSSSSYFDADRFLQTQVGIIQSRSLALRVVDSGKFAAKSEFYAAMGGKMPQAEDVEGVKDIQAALAEMRRNTATELLQKHLSVDLPAESRLVAINVKSSDAALSARLANMFANAFIESNLNRQVDSSAYARQFLQQQLADARVHLENSERGLNQYSRAAGLIRLTGQGQNADQETTLSITNDTLVQVNSAASQATADKIAAKDRWDAVSDVPVLSMSQVLQNPAIQALIEQRGKLEGQLADERARHLDDFPGVVALKAQLTETNRQIDVVGRSIKNSMRLDYEAARQKEETLLGRVQELRDAAMTEQDRGVQYSVLKRVRDTNRALYDTLLSRYNELNATSGSAFNNVSLVDQAEMPKQPSSPNLALNLVLSLLVGVGLAGIFITLRELLDDSIRVPDDVETKLSLPLLGLIPMPADADVDEALTDLKSGVSEAYNSLSANLRLLSAEGAPRTIAFTSSQSGEGKSTTARAVSQRLSQNGRRVLLVDADLRRPTLHARMSSKNKLGLSAVISGDLKLEDAIETSPFDNLYYLSALPQPADPSMLLGSTRFDAVFGQMKNMFDIIIVDCPPVLGLSDTPLLASRTEAVVFIVEAGQNHRGGIKAALRRLAMAKAHLVGAVLTKFDPKDSGSAYKYYGYSYYNYEQRHD